MPVLLENAHATALLNLVMKSGQGSCGTSESKSDSCADDGPAALCKRDTVAAASFGNNKLCDHGGGVRGVFMLRWLGQWLNGSGWPRAITTAGTVLQNLL